MTPKFLKMFSITLAKKTCCPQARYEHELSDDFTMSANHQNVHKLPANNARNNLRASSEAPILSANFMMSPGSSASLAMALLFTTK